jgi:catechol 2,3-dioxygenase-like lactoylglutathione lyase family enzyme
MIHMEHINLNVPDPTMAAWFYNKGLGLAIHNVNDRCSLENCSQDPSKEPELARTNVVWCAPMGHKTTI